ncbi:MAG: helix-turn-helix domain-containing protein [Nitrososphaerota archaeon]|nr:helix-turn-helix domain-containing protein [Nitrososphaerota archaeon]
MKASYTFTYPGCWACHLAKHMGMRIRFLSWKVEGGEGEEVADMWSGTSGAMDAALRYLSRYPHIAGWKLLDRDGRSARVSIRFRPKECPLYSLMESSCAENASPLVERVDYSGRIRWELRVKGVKKALKVAELLFRKFSIKDVKMSFGVGRRLGNRSLYLMKEAYERGYFDVPRKVSMKELSRQLNVPASTLNVAVRRALRSAIADATR